jgi:hypothetical protein
MPATPAAAAGQHAVDAVLKLVDAQASRVQGAMSAVNLNFKFGSENLSVRVEWRDGVVQTQFRTDSPELRSAIATEWQSLAATQSGRKEQLADPVFASAGTGSDGSAASEGEDFPGGGQPAWLQDPQDPRSPGAAQALPAPDADPEPDDAPTLIPSGSLHTFA